MAEPTSPVDNRLVGIVTLTTDFGVRDWYVGTMKGVILGRHPGACIVDITHEISPGDIRSGAFALASACPWFPPGAVHVAVVDPGVGGPRRALAVRADGWFYVGPDNGVLSFALRRCREFRARSIDHPDLRLAAVSATFHGRDVFAPAAAYLSRGGKFDRVGPEVDAIVRLDWSESIESRDGWTGEVVYIDRFGNAITNLETARLSELKPPSERVALAGGQAFPVAESYQSVAPGEPVAVPGSSGSIELAVNGAAASTRLGLRVGDVVHLRTESAR